MTDLNKLLREVYNKAYKRGWQDCQDRTSWLGSAPPHRVGVNKGDLQDALDDFHKSDYVDKIEGHVDNSPDVSNLVYAKIKEDAPHRSREKAGLFWVPDDVCDKFEAKSYLLENNPLSDKYRTYVTDIKPDPGEYLSELMAEVNELEQQNKTLRATHPNINDEVDADWDDIDKGWELEVRSPSETTVRLSGDHPFDKAVIEFETDAYGFDEVGVVDVSVGVDSLELVAESNL